MAEIIYSKIINHHYNNLLANYFEIIKIQMLVAKKLFWPTFCQDVETYVKDCNICLALKIIYHKLYRNF